MNGRAWTRTTEIGHEILETIWSPSTRGWLIALLMAVVVVLASWLAVRLIVTRRDLDPNRRISLLVLPTETFDPTDEEVDRYAAQLSRTRRTLRGPTGRCGQAVRLRLDSVGDGRCAYRIEGSARAASILQLTGFDQVELRPGDRLGPEVGTGLSAPLEAPDGPLRDHGANRLGEGGQQPQEGPPGRSPTDADRPGTAARTETDDPAEEPQP